MKPFGIRNHHRGRWLDQSNWTGMWRDDWYIRAVNQEGVHHSSASLILLQDARYRFARSSPRYFCFSHLPRLQLRHRWWYRWRRRIHQMCVCRIYWSNGYPNPITDNVYDDSCNIVDSLNTNQNACTQGIFGCSPPPIIFDQYTSSNSGLVWVFGCTTIPSCPN